jgi:hypothetical protein
MATFTTVLIVIGLLYAISIIALAIIAYLAPSGWEDEAGFHYGIDPQADDWIQLGSTKLAPRVAGGEVGQGLPPLALEEVRQRSKLAHRQVSDVTLSEPVDAAIPISERSTERALTVAAMEMRSAVRL